MEMEWLPLGQSLADKHRAAELKWRGKPPGMPPEVAVEFMEKLKAGSTIRKLTGGGKFGPARVSADRFKKHCDLNPIWAAEARRISDANGRCGRGMLLRQRTHCKNGARSKAPLCDGTGAGPSSLAKFASTFGEAEGPMSRQKS
jgi:hypothetical protein